MMMKKKTEREKLLLSLFVSDILPAPGGCWDFVPFCGRTKHGGKAWTFLRCIQRRTFRRTSRCRSCASRLGNPIRWPLEPPRSTVALQCNKKKRQIKFTDKKKATPSIVPPLNTTCYYNAVTSNTMSQLLSDRSGRVTPQRRSLL